MNTADSFIVRLNELLKEGELVLHSRGTPKIAVDKNKRGTLLDVSFYHGIGPEEHDAYLNANRHLYTSTIPTVDYNQSMNWIVQVYRCYLKFLGENDKVTKNLEWHTSKTIIEKKHIERILIRIRADISSTVKGDIESESEGINMDNVKMKNNLVSMTLNKIFIVHGHDTVAKSEVETFIRKIGFNPIILSDQANQGRTIIEKIEKYTDVGFGIVLYTPCDITSEGKSRARQNVILEHGFLMGKLGRDKVCALFKGVIEKPSDIGGIGYIEMDSNHAWELKVLKELQAAGYDADANKL